MSRPAERVRASTVNQTFEETVVQHSHKDGAVASEHSVSSHKGYSKGGSLLIAAFMLIFAWFIIFMVYVAWCPKWLLKKSKRLSCDDDGLHSDGRVKGKRGCIDYSKTALYALITLVIAVILFFLLTAVTGSLASLLMGKRLKKTISGAY
jgi:ABC-type Na+ efflux pump permease subunit